MTGLELRTDFFNWVARLLAVAAAVAAFASAWYARDLAKAKGEIAAKKEAEFEIFKTTAAADIARATEGTADALRGAATANERATQLAFDVAEQRERAARAELDLLKLQQRLAPRTMDPYVFSRFKDALRESLHKGIVAINVTQDTESQVLADQLVQALNSTGWVAQKSVVVGPALAVGIELVIHTSMRSDTEHGLALEKALKVTALEVRARNAPGDTEGSVVLMVGSKAQ